MMGSLLRITVCLISIAFCKSFHVLDSFPIDKAFSEEFASTIKIGAFPTNTSQFEDLGFGSVINRWVILTSTLVTTGRSIKELVVYTNCKRKSLKDSDFICNYKKVLDMIYQKDTRKKEESYVLLIVKPYRENGKIQPLPLATPSDVINLENCFFVRWERAATVRRKFGLLKIPFFPTNETYKHNIEADHSRNSIEKVISRHVLNKFNGILGAPLVCQLQNDLDKYVQIGIATINYTKYHLLNETSKDFIVTDGSFINIISSSDRIKWLCEILIWRYLKWITLLLLKMLKRI